MPTFEYTGRNNEGKSVSGKRLSQTADGLSIQLGKEGITPITIVLAQENLKIIAFIKDRLSGGKVSTEELSMFARQMHALCKTGVPITGALRQLAQNTRTMRMSLTLNGVVEGLESGKDLVGALQAYPLIFTPIMISIIRVGQNSGRLDEAFLRLNQYLEMENSISKRTKAAMRYPTFILIAVIAAFIIVNIFVIPTFAKIFTQSNLQLPLVTQILVGISNFIMKYWIFLLIGIGLSVHSLHKYLKSPKGRLAWDKYKLQLPIIGPILRRIVLLRFAQAFSVIITAGIPIMDGISLVADAISNAYAAQEIRSIRDSIQHGKNLTQAAATTHLFTSLELQMLAVSEETGELPSMLEQLGLYYQREVDYDLKQLGDIIEPVLIVGLAGVVLVLAFAVYLPIWNMVKLVH